MASKLVKISALAMALGVDIDPSVLLHKVREDIVLTNDESRVFRAMNILDVDIFVNPSYMSMWRDDRETTLTL